MLQITILLEGLLHIQPLLSHQTVQGTVGSSSLEQGGYNSPFVGYGVVGRELEVLVCVGGLTVDFSRERIVHYLDIQK